MKLTCNDFMYLHHTSMEWGSHWKKQAKRFEPPAERIGFRWAYWFESYPAILLARDFLTENAFPSLVFFDTATQDWMLLTDYESYESKGDEDDSDVYTIKEKSKGDEDEEESLCENCRATVAQGAGKGKGRRQNRF